MKASSSTSLFALGGTLLVAGLMGCSSSMMSTSLVSQPTAVATGTTVSPTAAGTAKPAVARIPRGETWNLVSWTSTAGVPRDTSSITFEMLQSGKLTPAQAATASRLMQPSDFSMAWSARNSNATAKAPEPVNAIELEAAYFPELLRSQQITREGDRLIVTGPGLLRFEFKRADGSLAKAE